jgi:hypothetical protein
MNPDPEVTDHDLREVPKEEAVKVEDLAGIDL